MVFLNGTAQTTVNWAPQVAAFRTAWGVLCYDARAQGRSDSGSRPLGLDVHTQDLKTLLAYVKAERAVLIGASHGAHVAMALASEYPRYAAALVLCGIDDYRSGRRKAMVRSYLEILHRGGLEALAWAMLPAVFGETYLSSHNCMLDKMVTAIAKRNSKKGLSMHLEALQTYPSPADKASRIRCPVVLMSGAQDPLVSTQGMAHMAKQCGGTHVHLTDVGHCIPLEAPRRFAAVVRRMAKAV